MPSSVLCRLVRCRPVLCRPMAWPSSISRGFRTSAPYRRPHRSTAVSASSVGAASTPKTSRRARMGYWPPCRRPGSARSSGSPPIGKSRRGGPGSATPRWCPAQYLDVVARPADGQPLLIPPLRSVRTAARGAGRGTGNGGCPRRAGADRWGRHRRRPLRPGSRPAQRRHQRDARRQSSSPCWTRPCGPTCRCWRSAGAFRSSTSTWAATWSSSSPTWSGSTDHQPRAGRLRSDRRGHRAGKRTVRRLAR